MRGQTKSNNSNAQIYFKFLILQAKQIDPALVYW